MVLRQQTIFGLLVADSLSYHAQQERSCLPLYFVRAETDGSRSASELVSGRTIENFMVCATNAMSAVRSLGKRTALDDVLVDLSLKDVQGDAGDHRSGMLVVLDGIPLDLRVPNLYLDRFNT